MPGGYRTLDGIDLNDIWYGGTGIMSAMDQYQTVSMPILQSLTFSWPLELMKYAISNSNGFQILGTGQRPDRKIVQMATVYPTVTKYGYGVGTDIDTLQMSKGREIALDLARPMKEDPENVLLQMLKVVLRDPGTANVRYGWYNGEFATEENIDAPPKYQQNTFASDHTHYLVCDSPTNLDVTDLNAAKQTIRHHGHRGPIVALINSVEVQALEDLAAFTNTSIIRSPVSDMVSINGFQDVFQLNGIVFHATEMMPAGYIFFVEANGAEMDRPIASFEPSGMTGLRLHPGPVSDWPLIESYFDRWMGFKVVRRGAGVVLDVNNVAYTSPTLT